jgi:hypothetical protein
MSAIFFVEAGVDYEGSTPVRAFDNKDDAEAFAERCREHHKARPAFPAVLNEASAETRRNAESAWATAHPGGDVGSPDYFKVIEVPFGPLVDV